MAVERWSRKGSGSDVELESLRAEIFVLNDENLRLRLLCAGVREADRLALNLADMHSVGDAATSAFANGLAIRDQLLELCSELGNALGDFVRRLENIPVDASVIEQLRSVGDGQAAANSH